MNKNTSIYMVYNCVILIEYRGEFYTIEHKGITEYLTFGGIKAVVNAIMMEVEGYTRFDDIRLLEIDYNLIDDEE